MIKNKKSKIVITIDGKDHRIALKYFLRGINDTLNILNGVEQEIYGFDNPLVDWEIEKIEMNSPLSLTLSGYPKEGFKIEPRKILKPFLSGMKTINRRAQRPKYFNSLSLTKAKNIVSLLGDGIDFIEFTIEGEEPFRPSLKMVENINRLISKQSPYYYINACHEGYLKKIDVHGKKPEFFIYPQLTNVGIRCYFKSENIQEIGSYIARRIRVFGITQYKRNNHKPVSIKVKSFVPIKMNDDLPTIKDLHNAKINITDGMDSVDYIREIRDAE